MRCGNRRKFGADRSKTKLSKNQQSMTSVFWRVGLKGLIILGSGARAAAAAAGPASPTPPGVGQLAGQLLLSLGMNFVSIPRVDYVLRIYRYLNVTVPEVSGLWYITICGTCKLYLNIRIMLVYFCVNIYTDFNVPYVSLYLYFLFVQLMFCQDTLYCDTRSFWCNPLPIPRSSFC